MVNLSDGLDRVKDQVKGQALLHRKVRRKAKIHQDDGKRLFARKARKTKGMLAHFLVTSFRQLLARKAIVTLSLFLFPRMTTSLHQHFFLNWRETVQ